MLYFIFLVDPAPRAHVNGADFVVLRHDAEDLAVGAGVLADGADVFTAQYRRYVAHRLGIVADGEVVTVVELVGARRDLAAGHCRYLPAEDEHDILADIVELASLAGAKALTHAHQQQQRTHAPGDAEHGQKRAQLVRP